MTLAADYAALVRRHFAGVLATHCSRSAGYPFASRVPYCTDARGHALTAVSALAQHTQNLRADPRVALNVWDEHPHDVQAASRATALGEIEAVDDEATIALYIRHFPYAEQYLTQLDFTLYRLRVQEAHYVAGFAKVHWLTGADLEDVPSWSVEQQAQARDQLEHARLPLPGGGTATKAVVAGIDPQGLTLRQEQSLWRVMFPAALRDPSAVAAAIARLNE